MLYLIWLALDLESKLTVPVCDSIAFKNFLSEGSLFLIFRFINNGDGDSLVEQWGVDRYSNKKSKRSCCHCLPSRCDDSIVFFKAWKNLSVSTLACGQYGVTLQKWIPFSKQKLLSSLFRFLNRGPLSATILPCSANIFRRWSITCWVLGSCQNTLTSGQCEYSSMSAKMTFPLGYGPHKSMCITFQGLLGVTVDCIWGCLSGCDEAVQHIHYFTKFSLSVFIFGHHTLVLIRGFILTVLKFP